MNSEARKRIEERRRQRIEAAAILRCGHREWRDGYCATMTCPNYVNRHLPISHLPGDDEVQSP